MKRFAAYLLTLAALGFASCHRDDAPGDGKGRLVLDVEMSATRAEFDPAAECVVKIYNGEGLVYRWEGVENVPDEQWLVSGPYRIEVTAGEREEVAFDAPWYKGSAEVLIEDGKTTEAVVRCREQHALVNVLFAEGLREKFSSYGAEVESQYGALEFGAETAATGYYLLAEEENSLAWSFEGTMNDGTPLARTDVLEDVKAATVYNLTFNYVIHAGGLSFDIEVDVATEDFDDGFSMNQTPLVEGVNADLSQPVEYEGGEYRVNIRAAADIVQLTLASAGFGQLGLGSVVELLDEEQRGEAEALGVTVESRSGRNKTICFGEEFLGALPKGRTDITISARDARSAVGSATLSVMLPGDGGDPDPGPEPQPEVTVTATTVVEESVRATSATVKAEYEGEPEPGTALSFRYREADNGEWSSVEAQKGEDNTFTAELTGLAPATEYEVQGMVGETAGPGTTFTTEEAPQIPNGDFETWTDQYKPYGETAFWGTANDSGSNGTTRSTDTRPDSEGQYSVQMQSKVYMNQFAAGNIYAGKFGRVTLMPMGAEIYFGRPFTGRPKALKGWYKYTAGAVTHANAANPDGLQRGDTDRASIIVALGDWTSASGGDDQTPIKIKTTTSLNGVQLFDSEADEVIAYAMKVETETVEEWTPFTIELGYRSNRRPTHLVLTASSSKNGDYFTGSTSSVLFLDDLEFVY